MKKVLCYKLQIWGPQWHLKVHLITEMDSYRKTILFLNAYFKNIQIKKKKKKKKMLWNTMIAFAIRKLISDV